MVVDCPEGVHWAAMGRPIIPGSRRPRTGTVAQSKSGLTGEQPRPESAHGATSFQGEEGGGGFSTSLLRTQNADQPHDSERRVIS